MSFFNYQVYLIMFLITFTGNYVKSDNDYKQNISSNMMKTILHDMQRAFCSITNDTSAFTKMYDFLTINTDITSMVFKLPKNENDLKSDKILLMNRRDFMAPTFPNLTESYITLRRLKITKTSLENAHSNITELVKQEIQSIAQEYAQDAWSDMGLDGWKGAIADPLNPVDNNNKFPSHVMNDYPHEDIVKDLNKGKMNEYLKDITTNALMDTNELEEIRKEMNKNVFIARANDPFGFSTKWQMKNSTQTKHKRDVLRLYSMIKCSTGCEPLVYKGYGCYCGFLGDGTPTDGIDRCCKVHDKCYGQSNCISYLEYFVPYVWKCYRGKPLCAIDHGEWGGPQSCAARLCFCDLRLSRCLRKYACPGRRAVCRSSASRRLQNLLIYS